MLFRSPIKNDNYKLPSIFEINPTINKETNGTLIPKTNLFNITPEKIISSNESISLTKPEEDTIQDKIIQSIYLILKFTNVSIIPLIDILQQRNNDIDIDITFQKLKYKELEQIIDIKKLQNIQDIYLEDIYCIFVNIQNKKIISEISRLIIIPHIYNEMDNKKTLINLNENTKEFVNTRIYLNK